MFLLDSGVLELLQYNTRDRKLIFFKKYLQPLPTIKGPSVNKNSGRMNTPTRKRPSLRILF